MKGLIIQNLQGRKALFFFVIAGMLYTFMLIVTIPEVMLFSDGMKILDMMPTGYDAAYVKQLFETLGTEGRQLYLTHQLPVDMVFPFFSAIGFSLVMAWILKKLGKLNSLWFILCYLPFFAGAFDYLENFGIISLLIRYPSLSVTFIRIINVFSVLKSSMTTIYSVGFLILLVWWTAFEIIQFRKIRS
ncbi:MAG: hypothetical protein ACOYN5_06165 [Bacteroidales bacterium]